MKNGAIEKGIGFSALAAAIGLIPMGAQADTFTVDTLSATPTTGKTTLADAINMANTNGGHNTVVFASDLSGTINLAGSALPTSHYTLYIQGPGASKLTIDAGGGSYIFKANGYNAYTLSLSGMTLTGASGKAVYVYSHYSPEVDITDMVITNNPGNGVKVNAKGYAYLHISDSVISNNGASADWGGAVYTEGNVDTTIAGSRLTGNQARSGGGAINIYEYGSLTISNSLLSGNTSDISARTSSPSTNGGSSYGGNNYSPGGGAIYAGSYYGSIRVSIYDSELSGNSAISQGGAIVGRNASVSIASSILSGNTVDTLPAARQGYSAFALGGAIAMHSDNRSGGLIPGAVSLSGPSTKFGKPLRAGLDVRYSHLKDNTAGTGGGAIAIMNDSLVIEGSQIIGNTAGAQATNYNSGLVGGAVLSFHTPGQPSSGRLYLSVMNSMISGNSAVTASKGQNSSTSHIPAGSGGALAVVQYAGPGVYLQSINIEYSTLSGNSAAGRGGALVINGQGNNYLHINNSTLTGNSANNNGAIAAGGHINTLLRSSTITGNSSTLTGSDLYTAQVALYLYAGSNLSASNTVIAGANDGNLDLGVYSKTNQPSVRYSFIGSELATGQPFAAGSSAPNTADPMLGSLVLAGGIAPVLVPQAGSPLIDTGDTVASSDADERGMGRLYGAAQDIGAVEVHPTAPPVANIKKLQASLTKKPDTSFSSLDTRQFFTDPDGGQITNVYFKGLPAGLSANSYGVITGQVTQTGNFFVTATARDDQGENSTVQFIASINASSVSGSGGGGSVGLAWLGLLALAGSLRRSR